MMKTYTWIKVGDEFVLENEAHRNIGALCLNTSMVLSLLYVIFMLCVSSSPTISETTCDTPVSALTSNDKEYLYAVVYTESGTVTTQYEWQLILECVLFKKFYRDRNNKRSITEYLQKYPKHFQGLYNADRYVRTNDMLNGISKIKPNHTDLKNIIRLRKVKQIVDDRLANGAARTIQYYHHTKVKEVTFSNGVKVPLNMKHINRVREMCKNKELTAVKGNLYHDFYERNLESDSALYNKYVSYRDSFR